MIFLSVFYRAVIENLLLAFGDGIALGFTVLKGIDFKPAVGFYGIEVGPFYIADFVEFSGVALAMIATLRRTKTIE